MRKSRYLQAKCGKGPKSVIEAKKRPPCFGLFSSLPIVVLAEDDDATLRLDTITECSSRRKSLMLSVVMAIDGRAMDILIDELNWVVAFSGSMIIENPWR